MPLPHPDDLDLTLAEPNLRAARGTGSALDWPLPPGSTPETAPAYEGSDRSGTLRVTVDRGCALLDLGLNPTWRRHLRLEEFGDALYAAYTQAVLLAITAESAARRARPAGLDLARAADGPPAPLTDQDLRSPNGYVVLRLHGRDLVGIQGNEDALRNANPNLLRDDLLDGFRLAGLTAS